MNWSSSVFATWLRGQAIVDPNIRTEAIDVKEGTISGLILDNVFDATGLQGLNYADSWIDIKGNRYNIGYNRGDQQGNTILQPGFKIHSKAGGAITFFMPISSS